MKITDRIYSIAYKSALYLKLTAPEVVYVIDGGICSQMHQYLLGNIFKGKGFKVSADLVFYKEWGLDMNRKFVRNFDLLKAFPYLEMETASERKAGFYRRKFMYIGNNTYERVNDFSFLDKRPPVYLGGYYHWQPELWLPAFKKTFHVDISVLDKTNTDIYNQIKEQPCPVAVHVRRGDLVQELRAYGKTATADYFKKAIAYFKEKENDVFFYFFSDEPVWVRETLMPTLGIADDKYRVVDVNGSDKGYMDLFLISGCRHQITSKGTLGKYGALLGAEDDGRTVILCDDQVEYRWKSVFRNVVFL